LKPIVFLTSGTRGDVQPLIALALGLQAAGKPVRIAAPPAFAELVTSYGLPFARVEGNPSELMMSPGGQSALTFDGNPVRSLSATLEYLHKVRPIYARMLQNATEVCKDASMLVVGLPTTWGTHIAEALGIPCLGAFLQPVTPTSAFPSPLIPSSLSLGRAYNQLTYRIASLVTWLPWTGIVNRWRRGTLGLKALFSFDFLSRLDQVLYGFSGHVVPRPTDWPENTCITGYWPLPQSQGSLIARHTTLTKFIDAGEAPVYIGFGSPGVRKPDETIMLVAEAVEQAGLRAVFSLPAGASPFSSDSFIFPLSAPVSHNWLFPQMSGLVHHGGAGTTAAGLLAGIPSLLCPLGVDQFFWAERVRALGVGPHPIPQRDLTMGKLAEGLKNLREEGERRRAEELAGKLKEERGVEQAVEMIGMCM
jgi:sterol 3beta-glucosyltransferase